MKKQPNRAKPRELTTDEVEAALHAALRDEGQLFPETDEDVAALEASLDLSGVPTPNTNKFRQMLDQHTEQTGKIVPLAPHQATSPAVKENLAMAARNGGEISEDIRTRMAADRQTAQSRKKRPPNGPR